MNRRNLLGLIGAGATARAISSDHAAVDSAKTAIRRRSLAERLTRRVTFSIGGESWPLVFTHRALLLCEEITGTDMLSASLGNLPASMLRGLLFAALSTAGAACSINEVGNQINPRAIGGIRQTVFSAWAASMEEIPAVDDKKAAAEPDSPKKLTWSEAWARARFNLNLSDEEWLDSTPRMCGELYRVRLAQMQREELLVGIIAATVENFSPVHPEKIVSPESFMLHKFPEEPFSGDLIMRQLRKMGPPAATLPPITNPQ